MGWSWAVSFPASSASSSITFHSAATTGPLITLRQAATSPWRRIRLSVARLGLPEAGGVGLRLIERGRPIGGAASFFTLRRKSAKDPPKWSIQSKGGGEGIVADLVTLLGQGGNPPGEPSTRGQLAGVPQGVNQVVVVAVGKGQEFIGQGTGLR